MAESHQKKLKRVRPPKVKIEYEVDTGDAIEKRQLPFAMGVLADLSGGNPPVDAKGKPLRIDKRKFVNIDRDNFNDVLKSSKPTAAFQVDDKLSGETGKKMNVNLEFESLDDFHPEEVAQKIPALKELVEARRKLAALKANMDGNPDLADTLNEIIASAETKDKLRAAYAAASSPETPSEPAPPSEPTEEDPSPEGGGEPSGGEEEQP